MGTPPLPHDQNKMIWGALRIGSVLNNACSLYLLAQALQAVEHFEENSYLKKTDCTALEPLAKKLAKVYEPCSTLVRQTELMEGLGSTYSQNYDIRPRRKESMED